MVGLELLISGASTTEELFRWPSEMAKEFLRWLDGLLQNNPLIIDPNALERHHGYPKEFVKYFLDCGIKIEDFIIIMRAGDHRLKPDGLHTGEGRGGDWNTEWSQFIEINRAENSDERGEQIHGKLEEMIKKYGVAKKAFSLPKIPGRR